MRLNLEVKAGEVVALVGPSGGGKTTLANLVPRFYDVTGGRCRIDGRDVRDLQPGVAARSDRHRGAGHVPVQRHGGEQHRLRPAGRAARMRSARAAETALAHEFIMRLPEGYDTVIGERGVKLSGGQRQRLAIARALLKNAPILILDEATSHLDTESRNAGAEGAGQPDGASHRDRDCAPAFHHPAGGQDRGAGKGQHPRDRHARRTGQSTAEYISGCTNCSSWTPDRWWTCERTQHDGLRPRPKADRRRAKSSSA